ncbi:MAG: hypothetical protein JKX90_06615 [Colwellia sp.]|nr:hypothetical protein [Colwellia sp.]
MTKVVFVTGASSGIGRVTPFFLAQQEYIVYAGTRVSAKFAITRYNLDVIAIDLTGSQSIKVTIKYD